ncbi:MAG TPA: hypothetical protein VHI75_09055, partial [Casimicrobiaceae bacterium]|nr:hypothetical protein [Casimicrobiaceae bacterium]
EAAACTRFAYTAMQLIDRGHESRRAIVGACIVDTSAIIARTRHAPPARADRCNHESTGFKTLRSGLTGYSSKAMFNDDRKCSEKA